MSCAAGQGCTFPKYTFDAERENPGTSAGAAAGTAGIPEVGGDASGPSTAGSGGSDAAGDPGSAGAPPDDTTELARGKTGTASSHEDANPVSAGNDADYTTRWSATTASFPQWWRVDLGATHAVSEFSVFWEHSDREYWYLIEVSTDDRVFNVVVNRQGTGQLQSGLFPPNTQARYVRLTVTNAFPMGWASFYELSIRGQ